jgi:hypothetical protein
LFNPEGKQFIFIVHLSFVLIFVITLIRNAAAKTSLPVIGAICCGALLLFLLAATIVLALIPIYIPQKTAALRSSATRSNKGAIILNTGKSTGRRKRQDGQSPCANATGATAQSATVTQVQIQLSAIASNGNSKTDSVTVIDIIVIQFTSGNIGLQIDIYVNFKKSCDKHCQNSAGPANTNTFKNMLPSQLPLTNMVFTKSDGSSLTVSSVPFIIYSVSVFGSPSSTANDNSPVPTMAQTTSTTASSNVG